MEPENEDGNNEYKLKLLNVTAEKIEKITTQMRYRCEQGNGECIYTLGVEDDGTMSGITNEEYEETLNNIKRSVINNNYSIQFISEYLQDNNKKVYELLIREKNDNSYINIKVAIAGSIDVGKSSILGTLISGEKDNGRGSSRLAVFNYAHEVKTGRTSSIAHHIIGFDDKGDIVNGRGIAKLSWTEIVKSSSKIISFLDLAGHEKYLKTTIFGLAASFPDICAILVGANRGVLKMTKEHIFLCISLGIPFIILVSKIDMVNDKKNILEETINSINKILKAPGIRRIPLKIQSREDVIISAKNIYTQSIVPIVMTSSVTGEGMDNLKLFLNLVGKKPVTQNNDNNKVEYYIDCIFNVEGIGIVTGGNLISGTIHVGDKLLIGPTNNTYEQVTIRSIHCKRTPVQQVSHGSYVCFGLSKIDRKMVRRGAVIISPNNNPILCKRFKAEINILRTHSTTIKPGYQPVMHCCAIRQSTTIKKIISKKNYKQPELTIEDDILRNGDSALVEMEFANRHEYIKPGMKILLCEGMTKVVGIVVE
jgi:GTPase